MKLRLDFLDEKYKPLKRDWRLIVGAILILILSGVYFWGIGEIFKKKLASIKQVQKNKLQELDDRIAAKQNEIASLKNRLKFSLLDRKRIKELNQQIVFFNLIFERGFSWFEFFTILEKAVPRGVWIRNVKFEAKRTGGLHVTLDCEALESFLAPQFLKNLLQLSQIKDPFLSSVTVDEKTYGSVFTISFDFVPFQALILEPDDVTLKPGEIVEFNVKAINFEKEIINEVKVDVSWQVRGNAVKLIGDGKVKAVATGEAFVIASCMYGRVFGEAVVTVKDKKKNADSKKLKNATKAARRSRRLMRKKTIKRGGR